MAEIITVERRRRWSEEDKLRIVRETQASGASVSSVAKRHGLHPSQVFTWRRRIRERLRGVETSGHFAPVTIGSAVSALEGSPARPDTKRTNEASRIEIVLTGGRRVVVGPDVDAAALRRVLDVLEGR